MNNENNLTILDTIEIPQNYDLSKRLENFQLLHSEITPQQDFPLSSNSTFKDVCIYLNNLKLEAFQQMKNSDNLYSKYNHDSVYSEFVLLITSVKHEKINQVLENIFNLNDSSLSNSPMVPKVQLDSIIKKLDETSIPLYSKKPFEELNEIIHKIKKNRLDDERNTNKLKP